MAAETAVVDAGRGRRRSTGPTGRSVRFLFVHEIDEYPDNGKRTAYLALAVLATIVLYYTYFTQTGVTPQILQYYHMSFAFYVGIVVVSNLIGAFASLPASKTDKLGRSNVIIYGLLIVGPAGGGRGAGDAHPSGSSPSSSRALGLVEGAILVATPALVRDFSPQLGRASAMGFWTVGPVAGSLITCIVATNTLNHFLRNSGVSGWKSQFLISGIDLAGGLRRRPVLHEGPVVQAPRPADGVRAGPGPRRGQGPRHLRPRRCWPPPPTRGSRSSSGTWSARPSASPSSCWSTTPPRRFFTIY